MSSPRPRAAAIVSVVVTLFGCTDIFHATDFPTLCETAPDAAACARDAAADVTAKPLCAADNADASRIARKTCARLSACNAVGPQWNLAACLDDALVAFDCTASPANAPRGARRDFWLCARDADDCAALQSCLLGKTPALSCAANAKDYATCAGNDVRVRCSAAGGVPITSESCLAQGKTCVDGVCGGGARGGCTASGCDGTSLHLCAQDGVGSIIDVGYDCTLQGDGACHGSGESAYCGVAQGPACTSTTAVRCEAGVAIACIGGKESRVNCGSLGLACTGGELTSEGAIGACKGAIDCAADACTNGAVQSCARKTPRTIDCVAEGLGPCALGSAGGEAFAHCTPKR